MRDFRCMGCKRTPNQQFRGEISSVRVWKLTPNPQLQALRARFRVYGLESNAKSSIPGFGVRDFERMGLETNTNFTIIEFPNEILAVWVRKRILNH